MIGNQRHIMVRPQEQTNPKRPAVTFTPYNYAYTGVHKANAADAKKRG